MAGCTVWVQIRPGEWLYWVGYFALWLPGRKTLSETPTLKRRILLQCSNSRLSGFTFYPAKAGDHRQK
jgi:hypothetical protein